MDNESQLPIQYFNFKNSDKNSDILSLHPSLSLSLIDIDCLSKKGYNFADQENQNDQVQGNGDEREGEQCEEQGAYSEVNSEKAEEYFNLLFSPKVVTQSLVRRNQYLEMRCLENSQSEPEEMYHKRKKRVDNLEKKEKKNWELLVEMKNKQTDKYEAFCQLMKLLGDVKMKLNGIRHDYYSEKTFLTLKKSLPQELLKLTKVLAGVLSAVTYDHKNNSNRLAYSSYTFAGPSTTHLPLQNRNLSDIYLQFLIIPRFFISKQKLLKFITDEKLQQNFIFLIYNRCLGHYNNEANKKLPEERQMKFIRELFQSQEQEIWIQGRDNEGEGKGEGEGGEMGFGYDVARERYKKICVINHGGKFMKRYEELYYELYGRSLECLKIIDSICKQNSKDSRNKIQQELTKDLQKSAQQKQKRQNKIQTYSIQYFNLLTPHMNINMNININFTNSNNPTPPNPPNHNHNPNHNYNHNQGILDLGRLCPSSSLFLQQFENKSVNSFLNSEFMKPMLGLENGMTKSSSMFKSKLMLGEGIDSTNLFTSKSKSKQKSKDNDDNKQQNGQKTENKQSNRPKIRRINSLIQQQHPIQAYMQMQDCQQKQKQKVHSGFRVKRWLTMEAERENNIIIVHPPRKSQGDGVGYQDDDVI